ncbi:MAG: Maf family protein [Aquihabitans sp.]
MTIPDGPVLVLASASPRRSELLARLGIAFEVRPADVDESVQPDEGAVDLVRRLAVDKAEAALDEAPEPDVVVLAADTIVVIDGEILGKPIDAPDAAAMLARLSGRTHQVLTGVAVARRTEAMASPAPDGALEAAGDGLAASLGPTQTIAVEVEATEVTFVPLDPADIAWYVATGEPLDKAGAYGIQGQGGIFVSSIRGNYDNVVGLPLPTVCALLVGVGVAPLR